MLVRFSSIETESVTMFGDVAVRLIRILGGSGAVPGAISAADIPGALQRLRTELTSQKTTHAVSSLKKTDKGADKNNEDEEPPIALATRAGPLIDILERASAAEAPVSWEKV